ncbi:hypothetical protein [uncultured Tenacibaculum sp.]|uniref:hypothetical protein n=1 Tax=uncultured Tenacibaculum sp. TaxID=174713 RepID=UPI00261A6AAC|nr:hypothetical protein [uncultured Tenacibaculum sp.]
MKLIQYILLIPVLLVVFGFIYWLIASILSSFTGWNYFWVIPFLAFWGGLLGISLKNRK